MLGIDILHDEMSGFHKAVSQLLYRVNYFGTSQETVLMSAVDGYQLPETRPILY